MLRAVRNISWVNKPVRSVFRKMGRLGIALSARWPVSGIVPLKFDEIPFLMYSEGDDHIANSLYYKRKKFEERGDLRLFLSCAKKSSVIFDVGANTGLYTILSHIISPAASISCFEPSPSNLARLRINLDLNNTRAEIVNVAVGDKKGSIQFFVPQNNSISDTSSAIHEFSESTYNGKVKWKPINVDQITLDSFVSGKHIKEVDLIKIDVEGYEKAVFNGALQLLEVCRPVIQCEIFLDQDKKEFFDSILKNYGYTAYMIKDDGLVRIDQDMKVNEGHRNYLFSVQKTRNIFCPFNNLEILSDELIKPR